MATTSKHVNDMTAAELRIDVARLESDLEAANKLVERHERRADDLEVDLADAEERADHTDEDFMRDQLDTLAVDVDTSSAPATTEQWKRCLQGILKGSDWRHGTWR